MFTIMKRRELNPTVTELWIKAPLIAKKAKAGQFIIVRAKEDSERIPLTIAGFDREAGTVSIIFQVVGAGTMQLNALKEGEAVHDFVGPLGKATEIEGLKNVCVVGGGVGCAIALPIAQALHAQGTKVTGIVGFRNKDLVILEDEFRACCDEFIIMTDDGSYGDKGVVTAPLEQKIVDEIRHQDHQTPQCQDCCLHEPDHGRRHRHVRRLPPDRWRPDQVCLCGRPRL